MDDPTRKLQRSDVSIGKKNLRRKAEIVRSGCADGTLQKEGRGVVRVQHSTEALSDFACAVARKTGALIDNTIVRRRQQQQGGSSDIAVSSANDSYPFAAKPLDRLVELVHGR